MVGRERLEGALLVNKPPGPTSHDIVDEARRALGIKRIGHAGTLDPAADGLLVLLLGRATRLAEYVNGYEKTYLAKIRLGITTDTDDATGDVIVSKHVPELSREDIKKILALFIGKISQKVPAYSAVKVGGERLYRRARRGAEVKAPTREIEIYSLSLVEFETPSISVEVKCSSGTYIRALARDVGEALGCGAHVNALTRTEVGPYGLTRAFTANELTKRDADGWREEDAYIPMAEMLPEFFKMETPEEYKQTLAHGGDIPIKPVDADEGALVKLIAEKRLAAVGIVRGDGIRPIKVFIN
jgi:tRNA pseudouridine55 synthase